MSHVLSYGVFNGGDERLEQALVALGFPDGQDLIHRFEPMGVSWVRFTDSARAVLHSWPEQDRVSVDVWADEPVDLAARLQPVGWTVVEEGHHGRR